MRIREAFENEVEVELDLEESLLSALIYHPCQTLYQHLIASPLLARLAVSPSVSEFLQVRRFALFIREYLVCFDKHYPNSVL